MKKAVVIGTGMNLPKNKVTNQDLEKIVDTTDEWIVTRTGIKTRYMAEEGLTLTDLSVPACEQALKNANLKPEDIDLIIYSTYTPDYQIPSNACILQHKLGCTRAAAFDVEAACSGYVYGSTIASQFIATGMYKHVLVVGGDFTSRFLDFEDRNSCVLFGDGVGATIFGASEDEENGVFDNLLGAIGSGAEYIIVPVGGSTTRPTEENLKKRDHYVKINGKEVFKFSTRIVGEIIDEVLSRNNMTLDDIALIIPHQANIRIIESAAKHYNCPLDKFYVNIDKYGNTVAATIPMALHEALCEGKIKKGDNILLIGFGAGLTYGLTLIKWGSYTKPLY